MRDSAGPGGLIFFKKNDQIFFKEMTLITQCQELHPACRCSRVMARTRSR
jgi:hypothetical protein